MSKLEKDVEISNAIGSEFLRETMSLANTIITKHRQSGPTIDDIACLLFAATTIHGNFLGLMEHFVGAVADGAKDNEELLSELDQFESELLNSSTEVGRTAAEKFIS